MTADIFRIGVENPVLRDHQVFGQHVLPGPAYIDLLYQSCRDLGGDYAALELQRLIIYRPLVLPEGQDVSLAIDRTPASEGGWQLEVKTRPYSSSAPWTLHARARLIDSAPYPTPELIDLERIKATAIEVTPLQDLYSRCRMHSLQHGPYMQALGVRYVTADAVYVDCMLGPEARLDASDTMFHPVLMDASAVGMGGTYESPSDATGGSPWLPLYIESFRARELVQERCIARVRKLSSEKTHNSGRVSLEFFDASGCEVASLRNFVCKSVPADQSLQAAHQQNRPAAWPDLPARTAVDLDGAASTAPNTQAGTHRTQTDLESIVRGLLAVKLGVAPGSIQVGRAFHELGLRSAVMLEIVADLERSLDARLSPTLLFEYTNIRDLAGHLATRSEPGVRQKTAPGAAAEVRADIAAQKLSSPPGTRAACAGDLGGEPVAIIAISGRFPKARTLEELWEKLRAGADCIEEIPPSRWDREAYFAPDKDSADRSCCKWGGFIDGVDEFDPLFFGISPREAQLLDPQLRLFLETAWELLESAGCPRSLLQSRHGGRVGVYVGSMYQHYLERTGQGTENAVLSLGSYGAIANRVSHILRLCGPSMAVDTACSSGGTAIHLARTALARGECELAIAGAVNLTIDPRKYVGLSQLHLLGSHAGSRSFGAGDGYIPAESVAAVLLKPLSTAERDGDRILAVIRASTVSHGGGGNSYTTPNLSAQAHLIEATLERAGVAARTISCVEAAANGSPLGDAIELAALTRAFRASTTDEHFCSLGSVKSNIGHAEAASALGQLAKVVLQLQHRELAPSIGSEAPAPTLELAHSPFLLQHSLQPWMRPRLLEGATQRELPRRALINSFGAGGSYSCLLVEEYAAVQAEPHRTRSRSARHIIVFSARSAERLAVYMRNILQHIEQHAELSVEEIAYTLQCGREAMECRAALVCGARDELLASLRERLEGCGKQGSAPISGAPVGDDTLCSQVSAFFTGAGGSALLQAMVRADELEKLALLWCLGADIPWPELYLEHRPQHVPLPTYPFRRERYWLPREARIRPAAEATEATGPRELPVDAHVTTRGASDPEPPPASESAQAFIVEFISNTLSVPTDQISCTRNLQAFGVDSIVGIHLLRALRERFGVELSARALFEQPTIRALARVVASHVAADPGAALDHRDESPASEAPQTAALRALEQFKRGLLDMNDIKRLIVEGELE